MRFGLGLTQFMPITIYLMAIVIAWVSLYRPKVGLFFIVPLLPFQVILNRLHEYPFGKDTVNVLFLCILIGWLINVRDENGNVFLKHPFNKYVVILFGFSLVSLIFGYLYWGFGELPRGGDRFLNWKNYAMLPILYFMIFNLIKTKKDIRILVLLMVIGLLLADYHYYLNFKDRSMLKFDWKYKDPGITAYLGGNELAAFYVHFLFLPLGLLYYEKKPALKLFYAGVTTFTLYPILYLFSRGAYVGLLFGLLAIGVIKKSKILVVSVFAVVLLWQAVLPAVVIERIQMTDNEGELDSSAAGRLGLWQICVEQFLKNPFGSGFNTYELFGKGRDSHNVYFKTLAEQGVVGIWVLVTILFVIMKNSVHLHKQTDDPLLKGLALGMVGITSALAVTNVFGDRWTYIQISAFYWVLMALVMRSSLINGKEGQQESISKEPVQPGLVHVYSLRSHEK
jgi:O-antigen ligase